MRTKVFWLISATIGDGKTDSVQVLMDDMLTAMYSSQEGLQSYEWFINQQTQLCHIYACFADVPAMERYLKVYDNRFAQRFQGCLRLKNYSVFGDVSAELRDDLLERGAVLNASTAGFSR